MQVMDRSAATARKDEKDLSACLHWHIDSLFVTGVAHVMASRLFLGLVAANVAIDDAFDAK